MQQFRIIIDNKEFNIYAKYYIIEKNRLWFMDNDETVLFSCDHKNVIVVNEEKIKWV